MTKEKTRFIVDPSGRTTDKHSPEPLFRGPDAWERARREAAERQRELRELQSNYSREQQEKAMQQQMRQQMGQGGEFVATLGGGAIALGVISLYSSQTADPFWSVIYVVFGLILLGLGGVCALWILILLFDAVFSDE